MIYWCIILFMLAPSLTWSADLTVKWTTVPGTQSDIEVAVWGHGANGPDDPKTLRRTAAANTTSLLIAGTDIDTAFHGTTFIGVTARKKGDTTWWTHPDKSYQYQAWPTTVVTPPVEPPPVQPPPIEIPPIIKPPTKAEIQTMIDTTLASVLAARDAHFLAAVDACLKKKNPTAIACVRAIRDAWKEAP